MEGKKVLVIEESSVVSDLVRDLLVAAGFSVVQTSTSKEGLAILRQETFDTILADVEMPKTNGYQLVERLSREAATSSIPVLLLTAQGRDHELSENHPVLPTDFIRKPIDPVDLILRVRSAVGIATADSEMPGRHTQETPHGGPDRGVALSESVTNGKIITVFSLKGGVGASTIAVNLAVALQKMWNESTALVDLSLEAGALNVMLDILPTSTLDELVAKDGRLSAEIIGQHLTAHKSGVSLLSAPASPERAELVAVGAVRKVLSIMKDAFDYVVIDTPSSFGEHSLLALELADIIVLPLIPDIASVRAATTAMDIFQALSISNEKVLPIFNEVVPKGGLPRKNVESTLHAELRAIPWGGSKVIDSINLGTPLVMTDPDSPVSEAIEDLALHLSREESKAKGRQKGPDLMLKFRKRLKV